MKYVDYVVQALLILAVTGCFIIYQKEGLLAAFAFLFLLGAWQVLSSVINLVSRASKKQPAKFFRNHLLLSAGYIILLAILFNVSKMDIDELDGIIAAGIIPYIIAIVFLFNMDKQYRIHLISKRTPTLVPDSIDNG